MMTCRVLIAMFSHETNRFSVCPADRAAFQARCFLTGDAVTSELRGTNTEIAGFIDVADAEGWELIPTVAAAAEPSGPVTAEVESAVTECILAALRQDPPAGHSPGAARGHGDGNK